MTAAERPMVDAQQVCKDFGALSVLKGVTLSVAPGEVLVLVGPSGSGKSTFLRCINHLETVSAGRLYVDGVLVGYRESRNRLYEMPAREASRQRRDIGMVFQHFNLFPHRTALENITEAPIHVRRLRKSVAVERARDLLHQVGLSDKADAYPAQLSGGQQQRVAIARAIVSDPKLLLCDEPTGDLDRSTANDILSTLQLLNRELGKTIIMVTHDPEAARFATRTLHLDKGQFVEVTT